jgi:hypothetical protein
VGRAHLHGCVSMICPNALYQHLIECIVSFGYVFAFLGLPHPSCTSLASSNVNDLMAIKHVECMYGMHVSIKL